MYIRDFEAVQMKSTQQTISNKLCFHKRLIEWSFLARIILKSLLNTRNGFPEFYEFFSCDYIT